MMPLVKDGISPTIKIIAGIELHASEQDANGNVSKSVTKGSCKTTVSYNFIKGYGSISTSIKSLKKWWQFWK